MNNKQKMVDLVTERFEQFHNGLISESEFVALLEVERVRGGLNPNGRGWIGYDYGHQQWIEVQL